MFHKNRCPELHKKLEAMREKFKKGQLLDSMDFEASGISAGGVKYALMTLKSEYELDILTLSRGRATVGWILAEEIL